MFEPRPHPLLPTAVRGATSLCKLASYVLFKRQADLGLADLFNEKPSAVASLDNVIHTSQETAVH